jgi:hypothetical protein
MDSLRSMSMHTRHCAVSPDFCRRFAASAPSGMGDPGRPPIPATTAQEHDRLATVRSPRRWNRLQFAVVVRPNPNVAVRNHGGCRATSDTRGQAMPKMTKVPLPLYTFLLKDSSGPVFLRHGEDLWLPLFTSLEFADLYARRTSLECVLRTLKTADDVKQYITTPPSQSPKPAPPFLIVLDPIDANPGTEFSLFRPEQFLGAV